MAEVTRKLLVVEVPNAFTAERLSDAIEYFIHGDGKYGSPSRTFSVHEFPSGTELGLVVMQLVN